MATQKATIEFLLAKLRPSNRFSARAMFGEYALYADGKVVALVCDNLLDVKIVPASQALEPLCEKGEPYQGAKPHYVVEEGQLSTVPEMSGIFFAIAESLPAKKRELCAKEELKKMGAERVAQSLVLGLSTFCKSRALSGLSVNCPTQFHQSDAVITVISPPPGTRMTATNPPAPPGSSANTFPFAASVTTIDDGRKNSSRTTPRVSASLMMFVA